MDVEDFTTDNIDHRPSVEISQFVSVRHYEESLPKQVRLFLGEWNSYDGERTKVFEHTESSQYLRCVDGCHHNCWLHQP